MILADLLTIQDFGELLHLTVALLAEDLRDRRENADCRKIPLLLERVPLDLQIGDELILRERPAKIIRILSPSSRQECQTSQFGSLNLFLGQ